MVTPVAPDAQGTSTRPYLIRALHDWCTDNGFTPYLAVYVDASVQVPMEYVKNHEIVLNAGFDATSGLKLGNDFVEFKARFGGVARDIVVPVDHVIAIYARENGQGMAFPVPTEAMPTVGPVDDGRADGPVVAPAGASGLRLASAPVPADADVETPVADDVDPAPQPPAGGGRPSLKRVK
jgi:stringent starvation protein B